MSNNKGRVIDAAKRFPDGSQLMRVHYVWPCWNCHTPTPIDHKTFVLLQGMTLLGIKCPDCLTPPPFAGLVAA